MKPSEIYNKYWKVTDRNGNLISPRPLTQSEAECLDETAKNGGDFVIFLKKRRRAVQIDIEELKKVLPK